MPNLFRQYIITVSKAKCCLAFVLGCI